MSLHLDIESFSETNLPTVGVYKYAEHASTEILVVCYAWDDGPIHTWAVTDELPDEIVAHMQCYHKDRGGEFIVSPRVPFELEEYVKNGGQIVAHNAGFERVMLNGLPGQKIGFPHIEIAQTKCTAAKAAALSLPRTLEHACKAVGTVNQKSVSGRGVMLKLCRPRNKEGTPRWTPEDAPDDFISLYRYCWGDVAAERSLDLELPDLPPAEQRIYELDQEINDRGVKVDMPALADVRHLVKEYKKEIADECKELTGYEPSQTAAIADWIRDQGYEIENLQAPTIDAALKDPDCPTEVRRVLKLRRLFAMNAVAKYKTMEACACEDGRIRGMFLYWGASTGRWSGRLVQLHNLHRGFLKDPEVAIDAYAERDLDWIKILYKEDPMKVFVSTIRGMIVPSGGKELICGDYKAFEGRCLAWLADDQAKLDLYRRGLVYEDTAAQLFGLPRDDEYLRRMKTDDYSRYMQGKTTELACGYQGFTDALMAMAKTYRVDMDERQATEHASAWRDNNPKIVKFWRTIERAAKAAIGAPGKAFKAGKHLRFVVQSPFLYMILPSKRRLAYYRPELRDGQITFMGTHTLTRQWTRCDTYGGKLAQNACEGVTRDILAVGMLRLDKAGYDVLGSVHDEIITEHEQGKGSKEEVEQLMCQPTSWDEGFPIDVDAFRAMRYRKD